MSDLKIEISADIGNVKQQVAAVSKELEELGKDAATATTSLEKISPAAAKVQTGLAKTAVAAAKVDSSLDKLKGATNSAGQSLQNVGRIAQDLPFGFIGIQNNLNPLLESFTRLKLETGSAGGALKAMAGSLMGAGGVGLALSVVSAAIVIFQNGIAGFNAKTKEAVDKTKDFANSLKDVEASGAATGIQLQNFVNLAKDNTQSLTTRNEALLQANKILGDHGEKLTLVNIATAAVTEQINKYTEATIQQGLASKFLDRTTDLIIKQRDASTEYGKALTKLNEIAKQPGPLSTTSATGEERITAKGAAIAKQTETVKELAGDYRSVTQELGGMTNQLGQAQIQAAKLFGELGHKTKAGAVKKGVETINDVLIKLGREIALLNEQELQLGLNESKAKISAIESAINKLVLDFKVSPKDTIIQKLFGDINALKPGLEKQIASFHIKAAAEILLDAVQAQKEADEKLGRHPMKIRAQIEADIKQSNKSPLAAFEPTSTQLGSMLKRDLITIEQFKNAIIQLNQDMADSLHGTLNSAFASIGESIAESLGSGADFGKTVFGNLFKVLGAGIKQLGESMIGLGTAKMVVERFQFAPGITTVIAGIATVALGSLLQKAIPGFAAGVQNFGGGMAVVGERGPELVRLPRGSDVIPNHQLNGMAAGGMGIEVFGRIVGEGSTMAVVIDRARQKTSRNG